MSVVVIGPLLDARVEAVEHRRLDQAPVEELQAIRLQTLEAGDLVRPRAVLPGLLGLDLLGAAVEVLDHAGEAGVVGRDPAHGRVGRPDDVLGHLERRIGRGARQRDDGGRLLRVVPGADLHERARLVCHAADRDVLGERELAAHELRGDILRLHRTLEDPPDGPIPGSALEGEHSADGPPARRLDRPRGGAAR
jgi:hypothetical protein